MKRPKIKTFIEPSADKSGYRAFVWVGGEEFGSRLFKTHAGAEAWLKRWCFAVAKSLIKRYVP